MEIAAPIQGETGKGGLVKYLIYTYPQKGNPSEEEIASHFASNLPFRINGVYLVATITPQQSYQVASERCDLYLTLLPPKIDLRDLQVVDKNSLRVDMLHVDLGSEELLKMLLGTAINERFVEYSRSGDIPFEIQAWLDNEGRPIIEDQAHLDRIHSDRSKLSGILVWVLIQIPSWHGLPYVKVTGDILEYIRMRKYFVSVERNAYREYHLRRGSNLEDTHESTVVAMICDQKLACFDLPFVDGSVSFRDGIGGGGWRPVKGCDAFAVRAEVVRIRKLSRIEELFHGKQDWEIVIFLLYCAGIILFYYCQFVFLRACGWRPFAWFFSLGMSSMAFGIFYWLHYRRPFPYVDEIPLATTLCIYGGSLLGGALYAVLRKKWRAAKALLLVFLESLAFFMTLYILGHAGG